MLVLYNEDAGIVEDRTSLVVVRVLLRDDLIVRHVKLFGALLAHFTNGVFHRREVLVRTHPDKLSSRLIKQLDDFNGVVSFGLRFL